MEYLGFSFFSDKEMAKVNLKIDFSRRRYGASKWQYETFDCVDLYIELLILLNCQFIDRCRPCRHLLKWVIDILLDKWDTIKFIEFEEALKMANYLKGSFSTSAPVEHFRSNRKFLKRMIKYSKKNRKGKNAKDVIFQNKSFFMESINKHLQTREYTFNILSNNNDLYNCSLFE